MRHLIIATLLAATAANAFAGDRRHGITLEQHRLEHDGGYTTVVLTVEHRFGRVVDYITARCSFWNGDVPVDDGSTAWFNLPPGIVEISRAGIKGYADRAECRLVTIRR